MANASSLCHTASTHHRPTTLCSVSGKEHDARQAAESLPAVPACTCITRDTGHGTPSRLSPIVHYFSHSQFTYPLPTFSRHPTRHPPPARSFPPLSPLLPTQSPPSAFCIYRLPGCVYHSTPRRLNMVLINSAWFKSIKTSVTAS